MLLSMRYRDMCPSPKPDDVMAKLVESLPSEGVYTDAAEFGKWVGAARAEDAWRPPGDKVHEVDGMGPEGGQCFEVYKCNWASTPDLQAYFQRLQSMAMFFIEAATILPVGEVDDDRWEVFLVVERNMPARSAKRRATGRTAAEAEYTAVGFCTVYRFFHYPDKVRMRIAQFLVLPPFQGMGVGRMLYGCIMDTYRRQANVVDVCGRCWSYSCVMSARRKPLSGAVIYIYRDPQGVRGTLMSAGAGLHAHSILAYFNITDSGGSGRKLCPPTGPM
jgi:GNAT superfamily N-acetyltransferase